MNKFKKGDLVFAVYSGKTHIGRITSVMYYDSTYNYHVKFTFGFDPNRRNATVTDILRETELTPYIPLLKEPAWDE